MSDYIRIIIAMQSGERRHRGVYGMAGGIAGEGGGATDYFAVFAVFLFLLIC